MDRPLKLLVSRIKDATSLRDRDDYQVWSSLFPSIQTLAEKSRRSAATNRSNLPAARAREQVLSDAGLPGGNMADLVGVVRGLLSAGNLLPTPLALELDAQFWDGWRACGCDPARFVGTVRREGELGFLLGDEFRTELSDALCTEFPGLPEGRHLLFWEEFDHLASSLGTAANELDAELMWGDLIALLMLASLAGPDAYLGLMGRESPSQDVTPADTPAGFTQAVGPQRAQLQPVVLTGTDPLAWRTSTREATLLSGVSEVRMGRNAAWVGERGALSTHRNVSRQHAVIRQDARGTWEVSDVGNDGYGSAFGTLVLRVDGSQEFCQGGSIELADGDIVCLAPRFEDGALQPRLGAEGVAWRLELLG